ncbi:YozE family protein [Lactobacillus sp. S2-2]|uniref:YozE family protein n=1 Tax=Lactobacillus sp. S2-2 TaxID=2692917 RepID=UPI001F2BA591|nr:YozE family protein [Lactobacillus sp. S2-2]MCF6515029.1 YozE family protein [Lactobacillus sp. S2-2]
MDRSFYDYLMTERNDQSYEPITQFANNAFRDSTFPKHATEFEEISKYLEENANYLPSMTIFDDAWSNYLIYHNK